MLRPLHDYVILKKEKIENTKESGIILSGSKEDVSHQGVVYAVGPKCENDLHEGLMVIFKEYVGTKINQNDEEYIILKEEDILAILE